jgi:hypothetical protein
MRFVRYNTIQAKDASVNQTSAVPMDISSVVAASAQVVMTGTAAGTVKIQVSNDAPNSTEVSGVPNVTNWSDVSGASVNVSGAGTYLIPVINISYQYMQIVYTKGSGTGTITVNVKTIGY